MSTSGQHSAHDDYNVYVCTRVLMHRKIYFVTFLVDYTTDTELHTSLAVTKKRSQEAQSAHIEYFFVARMIY